MNQIFSTILLLCTSFAIIAEILGIVMIDKLLELMDFSSALSRAHRDEDNEELLSSPPPIPDKLMRVFSVLSIFYLLDIFLLLFSNDRIFTIYGAILLAMSLLLWVLKRNLKKGMKAVALIESTICLIILIDVARTLVNRIV